MENRFFASGFFLVLVSTLSLLHEGRRPVTPVKVTAVDTALNSGISAFSLNNETIEVGLKRLASTSAVFAMGFEHELKSKQTDPPIEDPRLTLHLTATTVREARLLLVLPSSQTLEQRSTQGFVRRNEFPHSS